MPTVRTNDVETYYERHGAGRPLVCVHGAWTDHRLWAPQVEGLRDDYEVVVYDVRGHGRTGPSGDSRYTVELFAADLRALVEALGLERPAVCGLSLGGMVAQAYAVRYADALDALVLADTAVSTTLTLRDRLERLATPGWAMRGLVSLLGPARFVDVAYWLAAVTRGEAWFGRDEAVRAYVRETMAAMDAAEFTKVLRALYAFRPVDLASVRAPTLVLNGEHESRSVVAQAAHLERTVPDARTAVVPDAGHTSNMENPAAFDREVRAFLAAVLA